MLTYTDKVLGVTLDRDGNRSLANKTFKKREFDELMIGPAGIHRKTYAIENCCFDSCRVTGGVMVFDGVLLRNVVFDRIRAADALTISNRAQLDCVTIRGNQYSTGIWVKPMESGNDLSVDELGEFWNRTSVMLDISELWGAEIEIIGLPVEKVRIDPSKHVIIRRNEKAIDWKSLGIATSSLWHIRYSRLDDFAVDSAVYDIPKPGEDDESLEELQVLRESGVFT